MAGEAPTSGQPLHTQFRSRRERDWKEGKPPERPDPYWFTLATDAVWMGLQLAERGIVLLERIANAVEDIAVPGPKPAPLPVQEEPELTALAAPKGE